MEGKIQSGAIGAIRMRHWDSLVATGKCQDMERKVDSCLRYNTCLRATGKQVYKKKKWCGSFPVPRIRGHPASGGVLPP